MSAVIEPVEILVDEWVGCYSGGWKGVIVDAAFAHPAKVAFNLARRIYEHAMDEQWIVAGDVVVDPFGGIGGCAFHGLINGMRVVTCELEQKFVDLAKENRELWRQKFTGLQGFDADNWIILGRSGCDRMGAFCPQQICLTNHDPSNRHLPAVRR